MAKSFSALVPLDQINKEGILRPTRFEVRIGVPQLMAGFGAYNAVGQGMLSFWCETADLPSAALKVHEVQRWGYGPSEKKPYQPMFDDARLTFRSDAKAQVFTFLHDWMRLVLRYDYRGSLGGQQPIFEVGYKKDYAQDVHIIQYDDAGNPRIRVVLREAYPTVVHQVPLAWNAYNEYSRVACVLTYVSWYHDVAGSGATSATGNGGFDESGFGADGTGGLGSSSSGSGTGSGGQVDIGDIQIEGVDN